MIGQCGWKVEQQASLIPGQVVGGTAFKSNATANATGTGVKRRARSKTLSAKGWGVSASER